MKQQILQANPESKIILENLSGDLRIAGWDRSEIMARTNGEELVVDSNENIFEISCDDDLILYLPRQANFTIGDISGDVGLQAMMSVVKMGNISGDLTINSASNLFIDNVSGDVMLRLVGSVELGDVSGDFNLYNGSGDCSSKSISGDASLRDVEGNVTLEMVEGDLFLSNIAGSINAATSGDAAVPWCSGPEHRCAWASPKSNWGNASPETPS